MRRAWMIRMSLAVLALGMATGCGGKKADSETTIAAPTKAKGRNYQEFAALETATLKATVPFVMTEEGGASETPCLKPVADVTPAAASPELRDLIDQHRREVAEAVRHWVVETLEPSDVSSVMASGWDIEVEDPMMMTVAADQVRFVDNQECIAADRGWLPNGQRIVTLVLGAKTLKFKATIPLDKSAHEGLLKAVGPQDVVMESPVSPFVYEPAKDKKGDLMKNVDGVQLYTSPSGVFIKETEVPPPEQQLMKEWTLRSEKPLWFAVRELSNDDWRRESKKDVCDVNLIWGDLTPRAPECEEFSESAFTAVKDGSDNVTVTITTDGQNKGVTLPLNKAQMVQVDDRIILWLSAKLIEEGVLIRVNSLVIDPSSTAGTTKVKEDVPLKSTYAKPDAEEKSKDKGKNKKKDKKKDKEADKDKEKKKPSADSALDDYLLN